MHFFETAFSANNDYQIKMWINFENTLHLKYQPFSQDVSKLATHLIYMKIAFIFNKCFISCCCDKIYWKKKQQEIKGVRVYYIVHSWRHSQSFQGSHSSRSLNSWSPCAHSQGTEKELMHADACWVDFLRSETVQDPLPKEWRHPQWTSFPIL